MAAKEATVYIVDVGKSMNVKRHGRTITDLDWALEYIWDRITTTVATERKTALIGVIGLNTDKTENELDDAEGYENITIFQKLQQVLMPDIRNLRKKLQPNSVDTADLVSGVVVAMHMISTHCKQLKYIRRIVLVTNARSAIDDVEIESIVRKLKEDDIHLLVAGVDFDDPDYGFKEEDKPSTKANHERVLKDLADQSDGTFGTLSEAVAELGEPRIKEVKPIPSYKGVLTLGDPTTYDTALSIDVERYPKVMVAKAPTASSFVLRSAQAPEESQHNPPTGGNEADNFAGIKRARSYQVPDDSAANGKKEVDEADLEKGYAYGSTAVYISESDRNVTTFETQPGLDIIGFVAKEQYAHYMDMSRTNVIMANRVNDKARMALSSFVHALFELNTYAIARFVAKPDKPPVVLLLAPSIEVEDGKTTEVLFDVELPFAEDVRQYRFPPLDRILTVSGKTITQHRNLPSTDLQDAMSAYVDAMDLTTSGEEGGEYAAIEEAFSPIIHRINQVVRHRAIYPEAPLPGIPAALTRFSHPPQTLIDKAKPHIAAVQATGNTKKVPPKALARRGRGGGDKREVPKPLSGLDIAALLSSGAGANGHGADGGGGETNGSNGAGQVHIDPLNAVPSFKQTLQAASSLDKIHTAASQMGTIIKDLIRHSVGDGQYDRALECASAFRAEMVEFEEVGCWNDFCRELKREVLRGELGGDRRDFWWRVRVGRLGLITAREAGMDDGQGIGKEEADEFLKTKLS